MANLFKELAEEIFIADGGVDDREKLTVAEMRLIVIQSLARFAADDSFVDHIVKEVIDLDYIDD